MTEPIAFPRSGRVHQYHRRSYAHPIKLVQGEKVRVTKRDLWQDQYLWLWCVSASGGEGWVPAVFLRVEGDTAYALRDYDAIELTVAEGEQLDLLEAVSGWYWARNAEGELGWVPVANVTLAL